VPKHFAEGRFFVSNKIQIAPSILAADFTCLGDQIREAEAAGADQIHIDVMDGRFAPNITMGPLVIEAVRRVTALPLDVHLMMVEPDHMLSTFAQSGANTLGVHYEACLNLHRTLQTIRQLGCKPEVVLNPGTPASVLSEVLHLVDAVLVMTVNPGFGGQAFLPETMRKVTQLREMAKAIGHEMDIEVDGGVNVDTAATCVAAGATILVAGSAVFSSKYSVQAGMDKLRAVIESKKPV